jgi:hypothetical protein
MDGLAQIPFQRNTIRQHIDKTDQRLAQTSILVEHANGTSCLQAVNDSVLIFVNTSFHGLQGSFFAVTIILALISSLNLQAGHGSRAVSGMNCLRSLGR